MRVRALGRSTAMLLALTCLVLPASAATAIATLAWHARHTRHAPRSRSGAGATRALPRALSAAAKRARRADRILVSDAKTLKRCRSAHRRNPRRCNAARRAVQQAGTRLASDERRLARIARTSGKASRRTRTARSNPRQAPQLTVSGQSLRWTRVANIDTYVLMRLVPGQAAQYSVVSGISIMPPPVPGVTVGYSVRTTAQGSAWSTEQSITYASAPKPTDPQAAPVLSVSGQTLTWNALAKVSTYILMSEVPGRAIQYSEVSGTSITPPPVPGATVRYSIRTAVEGSAWAPAVAISYPSAPSPAPTQPTGPPRNSNNVGPWLGLNGNSGYAYLGGLADFTKDKIVYDRSSGIEFIAGEAASAQISTSAGAGMIPVVPIEYVGNKGNWGTPDPNFPHTTTQINSYVSGFITTARSVLARDPAALLEPMNEPAGYTEPLFNAAEYANVIAALLPEAAKAGIPLSNIYVAAIGENCPPAKGCEKNRWVTAMYAAQPSLKTEVVGWNFHPYGPPHGTDEWNNYGIENLPPVRSTMTSGQNNIIISEVGYEGNTTESAKQLTEMLNIALSYHEEGWLKALIVYSRGVGGWAMQEPSGSLTGMGEALVAFAEAHG